MSFFSVGNVSELNWDCFILVEILVTNWTKVESEFPSLPSGQVTLNSDNFKVDRNSLMKN